VFRLGLTEKEKFQKEEIELEGDLIKEDLPYPFCHYPGGFGGMILGFSKRKEDFPVFCSCCKRAISLINDAVKKSPNYSERNGRLLKSRFLPKKLFEIWDTLKSPSDELDFHDNICHRCLKVKPKKKSSHSNKSYSEIGFYIDLKKLEIGLMKDVRESLIPHEIIENVGNWPHFTPLGSLIIENLVRKEFGYPPRKNRFQKKLSQVLSAEEASGLVKVKGLIDKGKYKEALKNFPQSLIQNYDRRIYREYFYLKRMAEVDLTAFELLNFQTKAVFGKKFEFNKDKLIKKLQRVLDYEKKQGLKTPLKILIEKVPSVDWLKNEFNPKIIINSENFEIKIESPKKNKLSEISTSESYLERGIIFDTYPDPFRATNIFERKNQKKRFPFIKIGPEKLLKKLKLKEINTQVTFKYVFYKKRINDLLKNVKSLDDLKRENWASGYKPKYTGNTLKIGDLTLFEIDLNFPQYSLAPMDEFKVIGNEFLEKINELIKKAKSSK
jgi:hypothetical protein